MIELENHSAFPAMLYEKLGYKDRVFDVLAIKGTFRIKTNGTRADLADEQEPLVMADTYWGEDPLTSSLRYETDLILGKLRTDVHVVGHAYSAQGQPQPDWEVGLEIGNIQKKLRVYGPRQWYYRSLLWRLDRAEPASQVPIRYERAFGGQYTPRKQSAPVVFESNPIGVGLYDLSQLDKTGRYAAAQWGLPKAPMIADITAKPQPLGFGPLSRWWTQRSQYAGTYDQAWKDNTWPFYPADFKPEFFNSAPADQQATGFLQGNEHLVLRGLLPEAEVMETALGAYQPLCVVEDDKAELHRFNPRLETVTIDTDARQIHHTWRLTLPRGFGARHIVLGALTPPPERGALARHYPQPVKFYAMARNSEKEKLDRLDWLLGKEDT